MKKGWQTKKIGEVFQVTDYVANGSFATLRENVKYLDTPDYAVLVRLADFTNGFDKSKFVYVDKHAYDFLSKSSLKGGELIMSNVGSIGKVFKCPDLGMPMTLAPNSIVINTPNNDFYYYYFLSSDFQKKLLDISSQVTLAKFNKTSFKTLEIPIPSISEQQRIVSLLDAEFAKIDAMKANAERNLQNAKDLFCSTQTKVLENKSWKRYTLDDVCNLITDGTHRTPQYLQQGIPFLSVKNITGGFLDLDDTKFISEREHKELIKRCKPEKGDVLYSKVGTTGVAQLIDTDKEFSIFVSLALLKVKQEIIKNTLLVKILNSPYVREQAKKRTRGTANKNFVISDIKAVEVLIPPYNEQEVIEQTIDTYWSKVSSLQANYEKTLSLCDDLKQALLRKAFGN